MSQPPLPGPGDDRPRPAGQPAWVGALAGGVVLFVLSCCSCGTLGGLIEHEPGQKVGWEVEARAMMADKRPSPSGRAVVETISADMLGSNLRRDRAKAGGGPVAHKCIRVVGVVESVELDTDCVLHLVGSYMKERATAWFRVQDRETLRGLKSGQRVCVVGDVLPPEDDDAGFEIASPELEADCPYQHP